MKFRRLTVIAVALSLSTAATAQDQAMSFFITSINPGNGADLGGIESADAYCGSLAEAAGVSGKTWAAYLSTSTENARDRIGEGPWFNANGEQVAADVDDLHSEANNISKTAAVDETGAVINGRGDEPNRHDILTGSDNQGMLVGDACMDWTSSASDGSAMVGHHDRTGGGDDPTSWNAAHGSRGCSLEDLRGTGGDGLYYCFAVD